MEKSFSLEGEAAVGETVGFSITVENGGNLDLFDVAVTDAMFLNEEGEKRVDILAGVARNALDFTVLRPTMHIFRSVASHSHANPSCTET